MCVIQRLLVNIVQPYYIVVQREHIDGLGQIQCNDALGLNGDVELELNDYSVVALELSDYNDVALEMNGCSDFVLEQCNDVEQGLLDCIQYRLVLNVYNDVRLELGDVQLGQLCIVQLEQQLLCSDHLSHEYRIFVHGNVVWKQSSRSVKLCQRGCVQHFRGCVDRLVHDDELVRTQQQEHTK